MALWFRSWHGAPTDNKWLVIARRANVIPGIVSAVWFAVEDYASQAEDRGSVAGFDIETYATFSGFDEADIERVIGAMRYKGVITPDERLANWEKRQPKREDDSTDRVRNWRAKHVTETSETDVTQCNAEKRSVTHGNNTDTDTDTEVDTDADADSEKEEPEPPAPPMTKTVSSASSGRADAQKAQARNSRVPPELRLPIVNVILDITGKRALADIPNDDGQRILSEAHDKAETLYLMGYKTAEMILPLEEAWAADWHGKDGSRPTMKQLIEFASDYKAKSPARNGKNKPGHIPTTDGVALKARYGSQGA